MLKFFDKLQSIFQFKSGNKDTRIAKNVNNSNIDQSIGKTEVYNADYISLFHDKLADVGQSGILDDTQFKKLEDLWEKAKQQNPSHPSIETFKIIGYEYYEKKIEQGKGNGENVYAYERALERYK